MRCRYTIGRTLYVYICIYIYTVQVAIYITKLYIYVFIGGTPSVYHIRVELTPTFTPFSINVVHLDLHLCSCYSSWYI